MGSQFNIWHTEIGSDKDNYSQIFAAEYAIATAEASCKWHQIRPSQNEWKLDSCVNAFKFAIENNVKFRGHNLCWGVYNPSWLEHFNGSSHELDMILKEHITKVMQEVPKLAGGKEKIIAWDVVNEAVEDPWKGSGTFKKNIWYDKLPDYVDRAFRYAHTADPDTLLFYNDYTVVQNEEKCDRIVNMIKGMQERKVPIHGMGLQFHVDINGGSLSR